MLVKLFYFILTLVPCIFYYFLQCTISW